MSEHLGVGVVREVAFLSKCSRAMTSPHLGGGRTVLHGELGSCSSALASKTYHPLAEFQLITNTMSFSFILFTEPHLLKINLH